MKNKKGWIRIVEAFVAILLIAGVVLITVNNGGFQREDISSEVHEEEISILREIQINDTLRNEIISIGIGTVPVEWVNFPTQTKNIIESRMPNYLECVAKICSPSDSCFLDNPGNKDIYAESVLISSTLDTFNPRLVKLFCWSSNSQN